MAVAPAIDAPQGCKGPRRAPFWGPDGPFLPQCGAGGASHLDPFRIDELARKLFERVPPAVRSVQEDLEKNFRAILRERLSKLDLVSRDEFDAQARVLERTRARLEALETRLAALEGGAGPAGSGAGEKPAA